MCCTFMKCSSSLGLGSVIHITSCKELAIFWVWVLHWSVLFLVQVFCLNNHDGHSDPGLGQGPTGGRQRDVGPSEGQPHTLSCCWALPARLWAAARAAAHPGAPAHLRDRPLTGTRTYQGQGPQVFVHHVRPAPSPCLATGSAQYIFNK